MAKITGDDKSGKGFSLVDLFGLGSLGGGRPKPQITSADTRPVVGGGFTTSAGNTTLKPSAGIRMAANPATRGTMRALGNTLRFAGPTTVGVLGLLNALGELEDDRPGETKGKNIADAAGMGLGSAGGAVLGGILGGLTPLGPLGVVGGSALGSMLLGQAGRSATGGIYNLFDDPKARAKQDVIESIEQSLKLQHDAALLQQGLEARAANDALQRANEANFYNTANQAVLNSGAVANNMLSNIGSLL